MSGLLAIRPEWFCVCFLCWHERFPKINVIMFLFLRQNNPEVNKKANDRVRAAAVPKTRNHVYRYCGCDPTTYHCNYQRAGRSRCVFGSHAHHDLERVLIACYRDDIEHRVSGNEVSRVGSRSWPGRVVLGRECQVQSLVPCRHPSLLRAWSSRMRRDRSVTVTLLCLIPTIIVGTMSFFAVAVLGDEVIQWLTTWSFQMNYCTIARLFHFIIVIVIVCFNKKLSYATQQ